MHDPDGHFIPKEHEIASRLARAGASVHPRIADHTIYGRTNPDAMVRWSPDDSGTLTEFKSLDPRAEATDVTVRNSIQETVRQLRGTGGGDAVIDCRGTNLQLADARRGYARALGAARRRGDTMPRRVFVILPTGELVNVVDER